MKPNRLAVEKSPYLLQHAHNPVDWFSWGEEAFERARREDKPVLLSIGYSTCHWCHVMERESFEDEDIARIMNESFVCIKLDREERPDVDKIYMTAVQAMTGRGGWPLNVFLTPELAPFFGGTYFPPQARWGQPAWPELLRRISELWREKRERLREDAGRMAESLRRYGAGEAQRAAPQAAWLDRAFASFAASFDPEHKGFGGAPKFPMPVNLAFLLRHHARAANAEALRLAVETLRAMRAGGIFDQLGGGFHRYSTDERWRLPHFEKMLYDNAQLAATACEAYQLTGDPLLCDMARRTLDYMMRDLRHPEGGYYTAEDADSAPRPGAPASEGAFYLWSRDEIVARLGDEAAAFCARYGVKAEGNAPSDPSGEFAGLNVLYEAGTIERVDEAAGARARLLAARALRPRPALDDKILASWNGLALSALSKGAQALGEARYLEAAAQAASFLRLHLFDEASGRLWHRWRDGQRAVPGLADDYAFVAQGLLDLYEAGGDAQWLDWALALTETQQRLFAAPEGGFFMTAEDHDARLLARLVEESDNVEPCASSVAASNLIRLWRLTQREAFREFAAKTLERFGGLMQERPLSLPAMLSALSLMLTPSLEIVVVGEPDDPATQGLVKEALRRFHPGRALLRLNTANRSKLALIVAWAAEIPMEKTPRAYVCVDYACGLPVETPQALGQRLDER